MATEPFSRGLEALLARAARDPDFRRRLLADRAAALAEPDVQLSPAERGVILAIPDRDLEATLAGLRAAAVTPPDGFWSRRVSPAFGWTAAALALGLGGVFCINTISLGHMSEHVYRAEATSCLHQLQLAEIQYHHEQGAYAPLERLAAQDRELARLFETLRRVEYDCRMELTADGFRIYALPREARRSLPPLVVDEQGEVRVTETLPSPLPPLVAPPETPGTGESEKE